MNSLSWMIYLADIAGSLNLFVGCLSAFSAAALLFALMSSIDRHWDEDTSAISRKFARRAAVALVVLVPVNAAIPSEETVYAIAASEMGETALNSKTGGKAVKALNAWLDRQIEGEGE